MDNENDLKITVEIPFRSSRLAEVAYHVLRVDTEPKRSGINKTVAFNEHTLAVTFTGRETKNVRVAMNALFENIKLITETIELLGEPASKSYSHFV